jgi:hypothetical protein
VETPALASPTNAARIKVVWNNAPGVTVAATNPVNFTIAPAFVTLTAPNGGEVFAVGTTAPVAWTSNLGVLEDVRVELSADGGVTYGMVISASTRDDGGEVVTLQPGWTTSSAKIRVVWLKNGAINDASNGVFTIQ